MMSATLSTVYIVTPQALPYGESHVVTQFENAELGQKYVSVSGNCKSESEKITGITPAWFTFIGRCVD